jgi:DivIVA domain-containing protein
VTTALIYLVVMVLVAAVVFLIASVVFGRGEELPALPPGASPTRLPAAEITADDLRTVRFQLVLRGYKMSEVDWVLRRVGGELDELRTEVAELRERLAVAEPEPVPEPESEPEPEPAAQSEAESPS